MFLLDKYGGMAYTLVSIEIYKLNMKTQNIGCTEQGRLTRVAIWQTGAVLTGLILLTYLLS